MSNAGWGEIWRLVLAQYGAQPIHLRILIGLGIAFVILMIVEGLRVSFVSGRRLPALPHGVAATPPLKTAVKKTAGAEAASFAASSGPFRPRVIVLTYTPKRTKGHVSRHCPARPKLRRFPGELAMSHQP
ncbi:MAG TPA: hypothetical protein VGC27_09295, partial [Rhizomicrobium sp.]